MIPLDASDRRCPTEGSYMIGLNGEKRIEQRFPAFDLDIFTD
jgi:hypothetical protein